MPCSSLFRRSSVLWEEWPNNMQAVALDNGGFSLRGSCPYSRCRTAAKFIQVGGGPYTTKVGTTTYGRSIERVAVIMQCQACLNLILAIVKYTEGARDFQYEIHFPMGMPDDNVEPKEPPKGTGAS